MQSQEDIFLDKHDSKKFKDTRWVTDLQEEFIVRKIAYVIEVSRQTLIK